MTTPSLYQSSSIILCKRQKYDTSDFRVLMVKRQKNSRSFPNAHVFPGGIVDKEDSNYTKWGKIFKDEQTKIEDFSRRICSIRELFEETNILLSNKEKNFPIPSYKSPEESWFVDYCITHDIIPSIEKLIPFSQWITPLHKLNTLKRFDTMFYILELDESSTHQSLPNLDEISSLDWFTTREVIECNNEGSIKLAPPTYIKIIQMDKFDRLDDLIEYSRNKIVQPILPVLKENVDGTLTSILPGDFEHPDTKQESEKLMRIKINKNGILEMDNNLKEMLTLSKL